MLFKRPGRGMLLFLISPDKNYAVYLYCNQLVLLNKLIYASSVAFYPLCVVSDSP